MSDAPHPASEKSVEMPRPTVWPMVLSLGIVLLAAGVATSPAFLVLGGAIFAVALGGWITQLLPGKGHVHELIEGPSPQPIQPKPGTVDHLDPSKPGYRFRLPEKVHPISAGVKGGIVGGLVMPIPALLWGLITGHGIWYPVNLLSGVMLPGIEHMTTVELEQFRPTLLILGIVIHATISLTMGLMYGVLLPTLPPLPGGQLVCGGLLLPLLWTGASYGLMGVLNPALQERVEWPSFIAAQLVFGIAAAIVVVRTEKYAVPPAGSGPHVTVLLLLGVSSFVGGCDMPGKPKPEEMSVRPEAVTDFSKLFQTNCSGCHGSEGTSGPAPPLNDKLFLAIVPDAELLKVITEGRPGTPMPAFDRSQGGTLTTEQVKILAAGIKITWPARKNVEAIPEYVVGKSGDGKRGAEVFARACAGCHGKAGAGGDMAGAINDPAFLALTSNQMLRRIVITGRPDLGMPDYAGTDGRGTEFKALSNEDVADVVALLASWRSERTK